MSYALHLNHAPLQKSAERAGIYGDDWKNLVLQDLLHKGALVGTPEWDRERDGYVYRFYGRRLAVLTAPAHNQPNALFVFGIFDGPAQKGRARPQHARTVPGPWTVLTANTAQYPVCLA